MRLIVTGGGTGGHINPAISIAEAVKRKAPESEILFVGTEKGMESKIARQYGYPFEAVDVIGIKRSFSPENVKAVIKAVKAVGQAEKIIEKFRPDAAIGTGGYVCYPLIRAAAKKGVYCALHESNAVPGLAVKALCDKVNKIYVNFPECEKALGLPGKVERVGNPLRSGCDPLKREYYREKLGITGKYRLLLLSFGGSLGAKTVNDEMLRLMTDFTSKRPDILHVHGCGKAGFDEFKEKFVRAGLDRCHNLKVSEYIFDMPEYLVSSDLVISRAGAMTLSEIAAAGVASILIPSPNVADDHQYKNAKAFSDAGAAFALREREEELKNLPALAGTLLSDEGLRAEMRKNASRFSLPGAAEKIADELIYQAWLGKKERKK